MHVGDGLRSQSAGDQLIFSCVDIVWTRMSWIASAHVLPRTISSFDLGGSEAAREENGFCAVMVLCPYSGPYAVLTSNNKTAHAVLRTVRF